MPFNPTVFDRIKKGFRETGDAGEAIGNMLVDVNEGKATQQDLNKLLQNIQTGEFFKKEPEPKADSIQSKFIDSFYKHEGLLPFQTPARADYKDTYLGFPVKKNFKKPKDREAFIFLERQEDVKPAIRKQLEQYPGAFLPEDATLEDAIRMYDKENPEGKIKHIEREVPEIDFKQKVKDFFKTSLNPFRTEEAFAGEFRFDPEKFAGYRQEAGIATQPTFDPAKFAQIKKPEKPSLFIDVETPYGRQKVFRPLKKGVETYLKEAQPAFKWAISGMPAEDPKRFERMSWVDVIRESYPMLKDPESRVSRSVMAQFGAEMAGDLLEMGTRPSTYAIWGAMERFVPWAARSVFKKLPKDTQNFLLKERFLWGRQPVDMAYKELSRLSGKTITTKSSEQEILQAWRSAAFKWHPDKAPAGRAIQHTRNFIRGQGALDKIKATRAIQTEVTKIKTGLPEAKPVKPAAKPIPPKVIPKVPVKPTKIIPKPILPEVIPKVLMPFGKKYGIKTTPSGEKLLKVAGPLALEFVEWFKKTKPQYVDVAKLSTYTDGEPYFSLPGIERAEISLRDYLKVKPAKAPEAKKTYTVYQGKGAKKEDIYEEQFIELGPALGKAEYYTFTKDDASVYGDVTKHKVTLENPLYITNDVEWRALTKKAGLPYPKFWDTNIERVRVDQRKLIKYIKDQGYDGVIVKFDETKEVSTIAALFDHNQIIKFKEAKVPKLPAKEIPAPKGKVAILPRKQQLLKQIDEAIEKAPELFEKAPKGTPSHVTFEIDGGAKIPNEKDTLAEFRAKIAKTPAAMPVGVRAKPGLPRPKGIETFEKQLADAEKGGIAEEIEVAKYNLEQAKTMLSKPTKGVGAAGVDALAYPSEALSSRAWETKLSEEPETKEKINKTQIVTWAEKAFKVPIRGKATHKFRHAGVYFTKKELIRLQKWGELEVIPHEIAHHVDKKMRQSLGRHWRRGFIPKGKKQAAVKELADLDYNPKQRRTSEGFAEYIRHYTTTDQASIKAPVFHEFFMGTFLKENPDLATNLNQLKAKFEIWQRQGAENRILQQIDFKQEHIKIGGIVEKLRQAKDWILKNFHDEFYLLQKIEDQMGLKVGKNITPSQDPFAWATYAKSKSSIIGRTFVMEKAIDEYGNVVGPGLSEILAPVPLRQMKQFISYGVAKRAVTLHQRGIESGMDTADVKYILDKYKNDTWDKVLDDITKWSNHLLDWVVRAGGLGPKEAELIRQLNPVYLPFKRAFLDKIVVTKGAGGIVNKGQAVKRIKGSGRAILNPIESMISQATEMIAKAHKIHLAKLIADMAQKEGVGGFIVKVPAPMSAIKADLSKLKNLKSFINALDPSLDISEIPFDNIATIFFQGWQYMGKDNIVSIWRNGNREFYELHPDLYRAITGVDILKRGPLLNFFAPAARLLRLGATTLRVSFGLARNPFRDAFTYAVFSKRPKATVFDPIIGIYKDLTTKPGEIVWRFKAAGGSLAGMMGLDRAATMSTYDDLLTDKLGKIGKVLKVVKHPVNTLRNILSITELGPRSVEIEKNYEMYKKQYPEWTEEDRFIQAFNDAQDVTVNFTRSGYYAKRINEAAAFFNVAIRGPEKLFRSIRERPVPTIAKGVLWITLLAAWNWWKNKDKQWYKNLAPGYKYNNFWFEIGNNVIRLPIPFDLGIVFAAVPMTALDILYYKDPKYVEGLMQLIKAQVPDPTPSLIGPVIDVARNKNFLGIPIESEGMQHQYVTERKRHYTTKLAMALSKGLNALGIPYSPIQIDYLLNSYTGGWMRQLPLRPMVEPADIPVLGDMILRMPKRPQRQLNDFYSTYELLMQKKQSNILKGPERKKLLQAKSLYRLLNLHQRQLKKYSEKRDVEKVSQIYVRMGKLLERFGFK